MADPSLMQPPDGGWGGPVAFVTSLGALVTALWKGRGGVTKHYLLNEINPVATRVSVVEEQHKETNRRLDRIEEKLDRALGQQR